MNSKITINLIVLIIFLFSLNANAEKCLNDDEFNQILTALKELKEIRDSKAEITISEPIVIVRTWDEQVFINGGKNKPTSRFYLLLQTVGSQG